MIERKLIKEKINDYRIQEYILNHFKGSSYSHSIIQKTPLGEKIIIFSSKPGLIVGRGGENVKSIVKLLKEKFEMQSPQVEVQEINEPFLDASIVAEKVAEMLVRMGTSRFKFIGHRIAQNVIDAGGIGVEVKISGKVPAKRNKTWKFLLGYLPKCGYPADVFVKKGYRIAELKPGTIGVTVKILPPNVEMPDDVIIIGKPVITETVEKTSPELNNAKLVAKEPSAIEEAKPGKKADEKTAEKTPAKESKKKEGMKQAKKEKPAKKAPADKEAGKK